MEKAYKTRPLTANRSLLPAIEVAAANDAIPLNSEHWADRWCVVPATFEDMVESVLDFEVRPEDVFVVTFVKCGTTWMQEAAWLLMNNLDYEGAFKSSLRDRSVFMEVSAFYGSSIENSIEKCNKMPNPRLIKTHLPANLLPKQLWENKQKTIYVARNAKDVVVSSFHYGSGLGLWSENINEFAEAFMNDETVYTPFWAHIVDFWKMRNEPFIFFVTYEEMKRNLGDVIRRLCKFLGRAELTEAELQAILDHLSFDKMKTNKQTNPTRIIKRYSDTEVDGNFQLMRRGIVGSYKDELKPEMQRKLDAWSRAFLSKHNIKEEDIFGTV